MSGNDAISRIKNVIMPDDYYDYYTDISKTSFETFETAASAKSTLSRFFWNCRTKNCI